MDRGTCSDDISNDIWQLEFKIKTLKRQQKFIEAERYEYELEVLLKSQSCEKVYILDQEKPSKH